MNARPFWPVPQDQRQEFASVCGLVGVHAEIR